MRVSIKVNYTKFYKTMRNINAKSNLSGLGYMNIVNFMNFRIIIFIWRIANGRSLEDRVRVHVRDVNYSISLDGQSITISPSSAGLFFPRSLHTLQSLYQHIEKAWSCSSWELQRKMKRECSHSRRMYFTFCTIVCIQFCTLPLWCSLWPWMELC